MDQSVQWLKHKITWKVSTVTVFLSHKTPINMSFKVQTIWVSIDSCLVYISAVLHWVAQSRWNPTSHGCILHIISILIVSVVWHHTEFCLYREDMYCIMPIKDAVCTIIETYFWVLANRLKTMLWVIKLRIMSRSKAMIDTLPAQLWHCDHLAPSSPGKP